jgi:hypothetical protein
MLLFIFALLCVLHCFTFFYLAYSLLKLRKRYDTVVKTLELVSTEVEELQKDTILLLDNTRTLLKNDLFFFDILGLTPRKPKRKNKYPSYLQPLKSPYDKKN